MSLIVDGLSNLVSSLAASSCCTHTGMLFALAIDVSDLVLEISTMMLFDKITLDISLIPPICPEDHV
jgi:hypothetical protein